MIDRMNKLLKMLDKELMLKPSQGYAKNCKIDSIGKYEHCNEWVYYDAKSSGAHIGYHFNILTDTLTLYIDTHKISDK